MLFSNLPQHAEAIALSSRPPVSGCPSWPPPRAVCCASSRAGEAWQARGHLTGAVCEVARFGDRLPQAQVSAPVEKLSVLVPQGEALALSRSPRTWWPARWESVPGHRLSPAPRGAGREGQGRGRPSAAAPSEAGSEALSLTEMIYSRSDRSACAPDSSPGQRRVPCRGCCDLRQQGGGGLRTPHLQSQGCSPEKAASDADSQLLQAAPATSRCKQPTSMAATTVNLHSAVNDFCLTLSKRSHTCWFSRNWSEA